MVPQPIGNNRQHQRLTTALKNICRDYPAGGTVLRELLQNADDAGATEVVRDFPLHQIGFQLTLPTALCSRRTSSPNRSATRPQARAISGPGALSIQQRGIHR